MAMGLDALLGISGMLFISMVLMVVFGLLNVAMVWRPGVPMAEEEFSHRLLMDPLVLLLSSSLATLMTAIALYSVRKPGTAVEAAKPDKFRPAYWLQAVLLGVGLFLASTGLMKTLEFFGIAPVPTNMALIEGVMEKGIVWLLLCVVVLAPVSEELLFRRVLFARMWAAGKPLAGYLITGVLFALMHEIPGLGGNPWHATAILLLFYTLMGMAFAWIYHRSGNWWMAVLAHAVNNLLASLLLLYGNG